MFVNPRSRKVLSVFLDALKERSCDRVFRNALT